MNSLVSLPIAAAVPIASPTIAAQLPAFGAGAQATLAEDRELLSLVERFIAAEAEACRLNRIWDEMSVSDAALPADLKIQEGDADLGIPQSDRPEPYLPEWPGYYCGIEVERMRGPRWQDNAGSSYVENDNTSIVTIRRITPSAEARARADEIVAAYDKSKNRKSRAYRAAERAKDKAFEISDDLADQITEIQATSIQGLIAKARCAELFGRYGEARFTGSILDDLLAMTTAA